MATLTQYQFVGLSTEQKPVLTLDGTSALPAGSLFVEQDTGRRFYWTGSTWAFQAPLWDVDPSLSAAASAPLLPTNQRLDLVLAELRALRRDVCNATQQTCLPAQEFIPTAP